VRDGVLGSFGLSFPSERSFSEADRAYMQTLASLCALAIDRARLFDAERAARHKADQEVSERQRAARERDRFFVVEADLLAIVRFDGRFRWVSPAWERTLGWTAAELTQFRSKKKKTRDVLDRAVSRVIRFSQLAVYNKECSPLQRPLLRKVGLPHFFAVAPAARPNSSCQRYGVAVTNLHC
jgi:PAS domain-containing protein